MKIYSSLEKKRKMNNLFNEFAPSSAKKWKEKITADLKVNTYESLDRKSVV